MAFTRKRKTIGLALSGGSTLGIAHVGVLKAFAEEGIAVDYISGTSAGALVAGCYAFGMTPEQMEETMKSLNWRKLSRFAYSKLGVRSNKPMEAFLIDLLGDVDMDKSQIPLAIVATDIIKHEKVVLRHSRLVDAVRASTCIPGYFTPVEVNGRLLVDGWLTENLPLSPLKDFGADVIIGVNLAVNPPHVRPEHLLDVVSASFSMLARARDQHYLQDANVLIEPELTRFDSAKFKDVEHIMEEGYRAAMKAMPQIKAVLGKRRSRTPGKVKRWFKRLIGR